MGEPFSGNHDPISLESDIVEDHRCRKQERHAVYKANSSSYLSASSNVEMKEASKERYLGSRTNQPAAKSKRL